MTNEDRADRLIRDWKSDIPMPGESCAREGVRTPLRNVDELCLWRALVRNFKEVRDEAWAVKGEKGDPFLLRSEAENSLDYLIQRVEASRGWTGSSDYGDAAFDRGFQLALDKLREALFWLKR